MVKDSKTSDFGNNDFSNWRESKKQERKEGKGEGEKKKSILMFLYRRLFERQKTFPERKLLTS